MGGPARPRRRACRPLPIPGQQPTSLLQSTTSPDPSAHAVSAIRRSQHRGRSAVGSGLVAEAGQRTPFPEADGIGAPKVKRRPVRSVRSRAPVANLKNLVAWLLSSWPVVAAGRRSHSDCLWTVQPPHLTKSQGRRGAEAPCPAVKQKRVIEVAPMPLSAGRSRRLRVPVVAATCLCGSSV